MRGIGIRWCTNTSQAQEARHSRQKAAVEGVRTCHCGAISGHYCGGGTLERHYASYCSWQDDAHLSPQPTRGFSSTPVFAAPFSSSQPHSNPHSPHNSALNLILVLIIPVNLSQTSPEFIILILDLKRQSQDFVGQFHVSLPHTSICSTSKKSN